MRTFDFWGSLPRLLVQDVVLPPAVTEVATVLAVVRDHELPVRGDLLHQLVVSRVRNDVATIDDVWLIVVAHSCGSGESGTR